MSKQVIIGGQIVHELSVNEFKAGLFQLACENNTEFNRLLKEFEKRALEEIIETTKSIKRGKSKEQIIFEQLRRRETRKHCRALNKNMKEAGFKKYKRISNHHIVAWGSKNAIAARAILNQFGIDIDSHHNGVQLPIAVADTPHDIFPYALPHSSLHTDIYYANVEFLLRSRTAISGVSKEDVIDVLRQIATDLQLGEFPVNKVIRR